MVDAPARVVFNRGRLREIDERGAGSQMKAVEEICDDIGNMIRTEAARAQISLQAVPLQRVARGFAAMPPRRSGGHRFDRIRTFDGIQAQGRIQRRGRLPNRLRAAMEHMSGMPMNDVQVHYGSSLPDTVDANAYTQGNQIHLAPGRERYLAHEAWHVVQQKQRRVRATTKVANRDVNDNEGLEREADRMAARAASLPDVTVHPVPSAAGPDATLSATITQRVKRKTGPKTRGKSLKHMQVGSLIDKRLRLSGKRNRKGVPRYGIGDGTVTGIGAYALGGGLPTTDVRRSFTPTVRATINRLGRTHGCHQCGTKGEPRYVPDHQPPLSVSNLASYKGHLYPHCRRCSSRQGGHLSKKH